MKLFSAITFLLTASAVFSQAAIDGPVNPHGTSFCTTGDVDPL